jgi:DNA-binding Lrp family transcriptional regulator
LFIRAKKEWDKMSRMILDKIDLNILATLAKDCRTSYRSVGSLVGMTSKSVKSRVRNMIQSGIIEKFIVIVNPAGFGYRTAHMLVMRSNGMTKEDIVERVKQFGDLAYHVDHMGRTLMAALIIKKSSDNKIIRSLTDTLKPATVSTIAVSELPASTDLSETDLRIIKCCCYLVLG